MPVGVIFPQESGGGDELWSDSGLPGKESEHLLA